MAITHNKKDSLVETQIGNTLVSGNNPLSKEPDITVKSKNNQTKQEVLKPSFFRTTIEELKKVEWPKFGYVLRWAGVIVVFSIVIALTLGFFDHVFTASIKFVDCTSPTGKNQPLKDCTREFGEYITFRRM